ncbi:S41 family peptidase [Hymenobacter sp. APR13]|uniref:S41 family peptidase n=1 Tax=Hymenobacter sp. APR13 TaxID=1356852 RepID=UPI0009DEEEA5|nr:S41 family peptidase [Hymenobacter sp. APR13]
MGFSSRFLSVLLSGFGIAAPALAQQAAPVSALTRQFAPAQLRHDLEVLHQTVKAGHLGARTYHSPAYLDSCAAAVQAQLTQPLTEREFRALLRPYVAALGCGHTAVQASEASQAAAKRATPFVLPLQLAPVAGRLVVVATPGLRPGLLQPGDEVLALNQRPAPEVLQGMLRQVPSDGLNQTHALNAVRRNTYAYYANAFGLPEEHVLQVRAANGTERTLRLTAADVDTAQANLQARAARQPAPGRLLQRHGSNSLRLLPQDSSVAVLDLNTLSGSQKSFYKAAFRALQQRPVRALVLDLRDNGGGQAFGGNALLRYLLPAPFQFVFETGPEQRRVRRQLAMGFWERATPGLMSTNPLQTWQRGRHQFVFRFRPSRQLHYNGPVYVLTNGGTFSMASYVAAYLKHRAGATVVGEETGGGEAGSNAMLSGRLQLPETGQLVQFPVYRVVHQVPAGPDTGRGVLPTVPVTYSAADLVQGHDRDLATVLELIAARAAK